MNKIDRLFLIIGCAILVVIIFLVPTKEVNLANNIVQEQGLFGSTTTIYLEDEIKDPQQSYDPIFKVLNEARSEDTVVFHLSGWGGDARIAGMLLSDIEAAKERGVKIVMRVVGDSYSAHAFLAAAGTEILLDRNAYLYFHTVSTWGFNCTGMVGRDRADSVASTCKLINDQWLEKTNNMIERIPFLPPEAKLRIIEGHAVIVFLDADNKLTWKTTEDNYPPLNSDLLNKLIDSVQPKKMPVKG